MKSELQKSLKVAMKEKDKVRLDTIRSLLSAIQYEEMQKQVDELPKDAAIALLQRELKKRKEELEFAEKAKRSDLIDRLGEEMRVIEIFLPKQLSSAELEAIIVGLKAQTDSPSVGTIMKALQESHGGQYDGKTASEIVRKALG